MSKRTHRLFVIALPLLAVLLLVTCTKIGEGPDTNGRSARVNVSMLKTSLTEAVTGVALRAIVDDVIVYEDTTTIVGNSFEFDEFALPVGEATIVVDAFDDQGLVVYSAQTTVTIQSGQLNAVVLQLIPVTALMRLAPFHSSQATQQKFISTLEMYDIQRFVSTQISITFNPALLAFDYHAEAADEAWGSLAWSYTETQPGELRVTVTRQNVTDDLVPSGVNALIDLRFHAIAAGTAQLALDVRSLTDLNGTVPEFNNLVEDGQTVELSGASDQVAELDNSELLDIIREALGKSGGDVFLSELLNIFDLDAKGKGLTSLEGIDQLTHLRRLDLSGNDIDDLTGLETLTELVNLDLTGNKVTDLTPLLNNTGLGSGDVVILRMNPLSETARIEQVAALTNRGVIVVLSPEFSGIVTDAESSDPLEGVTVELANADQRSTTTGAGGVYNFVNMLAGSYTVSLTLDGYEPESDTLTIVDGSVGRNYEMTAIIVSTTISGTVTESSDAHTPIEGATVILSGTAGGQTTTDNQGHYQFNSVPPGQYSISISADGYQPANRDFTVEPSTPEVQDFALDLLVYTVSGVVKDLSTQLPISGVTVSLDGPIVRSTSTDSQGQFALPGMPPGQYDMTFSAALYEPATAQIQVVDQDITGQTFLTPIPQTSTVSGIVRDEFQAPIAGATVSLSGPANLQTTTGTQGDYSFTDVPAGSYLLGASASGYTDASRNVTVVAGVPLTNEDFALSALMYDISGQVTDSVTGSTISSAMVILSGSDSDTVFTNRSGVYVLNGLLPGQYMIAVTADAYIGKSRSVTIGSSSLTEDFELSPITITTDITGMVTEAPGGLIPISGATVVLSGAASDQTTTGAKGEYTFSDVPEGDYTISVSADGYIAEDKDTTVTGPDPVVIDFALTPDVFTLSGTVTEGPGGTIPIAGASVSILGPVNSLALTDAQGFYEFADLPSGDYDIVVSASGFMAANRSITASGIDPVVEDFVLAPEAFTVSGAITASGSLAAIEGAVISLDGPVTKKDTSDVQGAYEITGVPAGSYTLTVTASGYESVVLLFDVSNQSVIQNVSLDPVLISGTVTNSLGTELIGVSIDLSGPSPMSTTTDQNGNYQFTMVSSGSYTLEASLSGYRTASENLNVDGVNLVQDFVLKAATSVSGFVEDGFGSGIQNVTVELNGPESQTTLTDGNGAYSFSDVLEGSYDIKVSKTGLVPQSRPTTVAGSPVVENFILQLGTTVQGLVTDALSGANLEGALVSFTGGGITYPTLSISNGTFNLGTIPQINYAVTVALAGYELYTSSVTLTGSFHFLPVELVPLLSSIYGYVYDAQTANAISGATVSVTGPVDRSTPSGFDGYYLGDIPYGAYQMTVSAPGYVDNTRMVTLGSTELEENFYLSEALGGEALRVVLTWNGLPSDMDLHYWIFDTPTDTAFINWLTPGTLSAFPFAHLDIDETNGYGPETITIGQFIAPSQVLIDNYAHRLEGETTTTPQSGAHLDVYSGSSLVLQLNVPTSGTGDWWHAFDIDASGNITVVNQLIDIFFPAVSPISEEKRHTPTH